VIQRGAVPEDVLPTLARVVASGAVADARERALAFAARAAAELDVVSPDVDRDALRDAVRIASDRSS
jgi:hypothetical protein